jgi:hypothetical protein
MTRTSTPNRGNPFSRTALALALSLGVAAGALVAQPAFAAKPPAGPKIEFSSGFAKAAAELDKSLADASKNAEVTAATAQVRSAGARQSSMRQPPRRARPETSSSLAR